MFHLILSWVLAYPVIGISLYFNGSFLPQWVLVYLWMSHIPPCDRSFLSTQVTPQEFPAMASLSLTASDGILLVFSLNSPQSFEEVTPLGKYSWSLKTIVQIVLQVTSLRDWIQASNVATPIVRSAVQYKLDGVVGLVVDPPPARQNPPICDPLRHPSPVCQKKKKIWHLTHDMWHMTCDTWHRTSFEGWLHFFCEIAKKFIHDKEGFFPSQRIHLFYTKPTAQTLNTFIHIQQTCRRRRYDLE